MSEDAPTITLAALLNLSIRSGVGAVDVSLEAEVQAFDATAQTVDVIVCVRQRRDNSDGTTTDAPFPKLANIPIAWPAVSGGSFTLGPPAVGDRVQLVIRSRSHTEVRAGAPIPTLPASGRRWSLLDAWVQPSPAAALPSGAFASDGATLRLGAGRKFRVGSSTGARALALAYKVEAELAKIQTAHNTHTHTIPSGTSGTASVTYTPGTVDSTRLFTDDT